MCPAEPAGRVLEAHGNVRPRGMTVITRKRRNRIRLIGALPLLQPNAVDVSAKKTCTRKVLKKCGYSSSTKLRGQVRIDFRYAVHIIKNRDNRPLNSKMQGRARRFGRFPATSRTNTRVFHVPIESAGTTAATVRPCLVMLVAQRWAAALMSAGSCLRAASTPVVRGCRLMRVISLLDRTLSMRAAGSQRST